MNTRFMEVEVELGKHLDKILEQSLPADAFNFRPPVRELPGGDGPPTLEVKLSKKIAENADLGQLPQEWEGMPIVYAVLGL